MDQHPFNRITRRGFLAGTIAAALAACSDGSSDGTGATENPTSSLVSPPSPSSGATPSTSTPLVGSDPFTVGVASGDPLDDRIILWTALAPQDSVPTGDVQVDWEVATDEGFTNVISSGVAPAVAALGHSVHVDASGLEPDTAYYYRFSLEDYTSPVGRTRTFAATGSTPERFRFAFSSCQNWEQGYYAAYRDIVANGNIDAFVFLGDYIYEYASGGYADPRGRRTGQSFECETLEQYRQRYRLYKSDPMLRDAHALVPWIITWDDHEVDNDYAGSRAEDAADSGVFLARRAAAYQAWYETMPVRIEVPSGPDVAIYRSFAHGDLVRFHVLDTRQYRSDQQRNDPFLPSLGDAVQVRDEVMAADPEHTILGAAQRQWLIDSAAGSDAVWDVLAQQVLMFGGNAVPGAQPPVVVVDTWDGYDSDRRAVLDALSTEVDNLVVLTGDLHSAAVADLRVNPFDESLPIVGSEFMAPSISSSFFDDTAVARLVSAALGANPHLKWFDSRRGYTVCEVTPLRWLATYRAVEDQFDESSAVITVSSWEVLAGTPGVRQVS